MDLLRRFTLGDIDAFETLVRQIQGDIYAWIIRIVRDPGIAEDLTVEALWGIYRSRERFRVGGNFDGWARRIATNLAIDYLRRKKPEDVLTEEPVATSRPDHLVETEMWERIQEAFRRLPAKLQVTARLALIEERPYEEIAEALGTSVGAVKLRVFRAVRLLRKHLSGLGVMPKG
jgi:RNA polymerase sigma-70 factor (ECF subfamily)